MPEETFEELKFSRWFRKYPPKKFHNVEPEVSLYDAYCVLGKDFNYGKPLVKNQNSGKFSGNRVIGRVDLVFTYNRVRYVAEVKYYRDNKKFEFWDALKVLGYCEYLNWQRNVDYDVYKPAVMAPESKYMLEHFMVAQKLKLALFAIKKTPDGFYDVYKVDDGMEFLINSRKSPGL